MVAVADGGGVVSTEAIDLLIRADGLLGLSRHRGLNGDDWQWARDADNLISDIRAFMRDHARGRDVGR